MKKYLFTLATTVSLMTLNAQTVLFEDDFEAYEDFAISNIGDWTLVDVDGSDLYGFTGISFPNSGGPFAYIVFNSTTTTPPMEPSESSDWTARSGSRAMVSFAAVPPPSGNGPNNDWLISPAIELGGSDNNLSFWFKACDANYGMEEFNVMISTTGTDPSNFTPIEEFLTVETPLVWTEFTANLDTYANQTVYLAIQCTSNDQFGFAVDDFKVTSGDLGVSDLENKLTSIYPNPVIDVFSLNLNSKFDKNNVKISLTNLVGETVKNFDINTSYNISDLTSGLYVVKITDGKNTEYKKIIKKGIILKNSW